MRTRALSATATLVGKTQEQVRAVGHRRDVDYLRDPATASMRAGSPTSGVYSRIRGRAGGLLSVAAYDDRR